MLFGLIKSKQKPKEIIEALEVLKEAEKRLVANGLFDQEAFDLVREPIKKLLKTHPDVIVKLFREHPDLGTPRDWVYAQISNIAGDLLESGKFHIYGGLLSTVSPGPALLRMFDICYDELIGFW